jgi:hypothetical protein
LNYSSFNLFNVPTRGRLIGRLPELQHSQNPRNVQHE